MITPFNTPRVAFCVHVKPCPQAWTGTQLCRQRFHMSSLALPRPIQGFCRPSPECGWPWPHFLMSSMHSRHSALHCWGQVKGVILLLPLSLYLLKCFLMKLEGPEGQGQPPANCQWGTKALSPVPQRVSLPLGKLKDILLRRAYDSRSEWHLDCNLRESLSQRTWLSHAQFLIHRNCEQQMMLKLC